MTTAYQATRALTDIFKQNMGKASRSDVLAYQSLLYNTDSFGNLQGRHLRRLVEDGRTDLLQAKGARKAYEAVKGGIASFFGKETTYQRSQAALANVVKAYGKQQDVEAEVADLEANVASYSAPLLSARRSTLARKKAAIAQSVVSYGDTVTQSLLERVGYVSTPETPATFTVDERFVPKAQGKTLSDYVVDARDAAAAGLDALTPKTPAGRFGYAFAGLLSVFGAFGSASQPTTYQAELEKPQAALTSAVAPDLVFEGTVVDQTGAERHATVSIDFSEDEKPFPRAKHHTWYSPDSANVTKHEHDDATIRDLVEDWEGNPTLLGISTSLDDGIHSVWLSADPEAPVFHDPTARAGLVLVEDGVMKGTMTYNYEDLDMGSVLGPMSLYDHVDQLPAIPVSILKGQGDAIMEQYNFDPCYPGLWPGEILPEGFKVDPECLEATGRSADAPFLGV